MLIVKSLPTRERGLKSSTSCRFSCGTVVAPYTGAWIEIRNTHVLFIRDIVAPYTGAWIEIV